MSNIQVQDKTFEQMMTPKDDSRLAELAVVAQAFAISGYFKDFDKDNARRGAAQALVKILRGQDLGISPSASVESIHIIENRTAMSAHLMSALIRRDGHYFVIREHTDKVCRIAFYTSSDILVGESSFSVEQAHRVRFYDKFKKQWKTLLDKDNWKYYPEDMLYARAMSRGFRRFFSHLAMGGVFTPEEIAEQIEPHDDTVEVDQSHIDAEQALYKAVGVVVDSPEIERESKTPSQSASQGGAIRDHTDSADMDDDDPEDETEGPDAEESVEDPSFVHEVLLQEMRAIWGDHDETKDMMRICELMAPTPRRGGNEVEPVAISSLSELSEKEVKRCLTMVNRLRNSKEYTDDRIFDFFCFVINNNYLINTTRSLDAACTAFVEDENAAV